ncbi:MAG TPA: DUF4290 domain-containing protein [Flavilitoribacter sp.]|nr:DUF4290 domain-containing protein [Flavilitoribacter sp.]
MNEGSHNMTYNSEREDIIIPEYGRHVQELIAHAKTIEDTRTRQVFVERVIQLMMQIHPQSRNIEDYRDKLWKHVFRIANYELEVETPTGVKPSWEDAHKRPDMIPYPEKEARFRHYGHNVQKLIQKAIAMPEGPKRDGFVATIGSYMKLAYKTWNKDHYVSDDVIKNDLDSLSGGKLVLADASLGGLDNLSSNKQKRRRPDNNNNNYQKNSRNDKQRSRGGGGMQRRRKM